MATSRLLLEKKEDLGLLYAKELECLRNASLADLSKHSIPNWGTPGLFGIDKLNPDGMGAYYAPLAIVDGKVIVSMMNECE